MKDIEQHSGLRNILVLLEDSRRCYMELCNHVQDTRTKDFLNSLSWERIALETALTAEARRVGILPVAGNQSGSDDRSSALVEMCKSVINAKGDQVLAACERGEGYLLKLYDEALKAGKLDDSTRTVLIRQRAQVQGNVNSVRSRALTEVQAGK